MAKNSDGKKDNSKRSAYVPTILDMQAIKAVQRIVEANSKAKVKPAKTTEISNLIFGNPTVFSQIKSYRRGISIPQVIALASYFNIDYNYFFNSEADFQYDPANMGKERPNNTISSKGSKNTIISVGSGSIEGGIRTGGTDKVINRAKKLIVNFDPDDKKQCMSILSNLEVEHHKDMENLILEKTEDIKKISDAFERQLREKDQQLKKTMKEKEDVLSRYVDLLEKVASK